MFSIWLQTRSSDNYTC